VTEAEEAQHRTGRSLWLSVLALAVLQFLVLTPVLSVYLGGLQDEGAPALLGLRVSEGQIPYRDYFSQATPGTDICMAVAFKVAGANVTTLRLYFAVSLSLLAGLIQLFSCRLLPAKWSEAPALFFICVGAQAWPMAFCHWDANLFCVGALLLLLSRHRWRLFLTGLVAGLTVLFLQTKGAGVVIGLLIAVFLEPSTLKERVRKCAVYLSGVSVPGLGFVSFLLYYGIFGEFLYDTVGFNATQYMDNQSSQFELYSVFAGLKSLAAGFGNLGSVPLLDWLRWFAYAGSFVVVDIWHYGLYYPLVVAASVWSVHRLIRGGHSNLNTAIAAACIILFLVSSLDLVRPNRYHLNFHTPLYYPISVLILYRLSRLRFRVALTGLTIFLALNYAMLGGFYLQSWSAYRYPIAFPRGTLYANHPGLAKQLSDLVVEVDRYCPIDSTLFGFPGEHFLLFLLGRTNPTPYPGAFPIFYTDEQLEDIRAHLTEARTTCLLYHPAQISPENYPSMDPQFYLSEQERMAKFLTQGFTERKQLGTWKIFVRDE
jgi:hypothetical protein